MCSNISGVKMIPPAPTPYFCILFGSSHPFGAAQPLESAKIWRVSGGIIEAEKSLGNQSIWQLFRYHFSNTKTYFFFIPTRCSTMISQKLGKTIAKPCCAKRKPCCARVVHLFSKLTMWGFCHTLCKRLVPTITQTDCSKLPDHVETTSRPRRRSREWHRLPNWVFAKEGEKPFATMSEHVKVGKEKI